MNEDINAVMDQELEYLLNFDPLDRAERITGKSYKDSETTSNVGFLLHMDVNKEKKQLLNALGDTHFSIGFHEFQKVLKRAGFEKVWSQPFTRIDDEIQEEEQVWVKKNEGFLVYLTSFSSHGDHDISVNNADVFFNVNIGNWLEYLASDAPRLQGYSGGLGPMDGCRTNQDQDWFLAGSFDVREALAHKLNNVRKAGVLMPVWKDCPCLFNLVNYGVKSGFQDWNQDIKTRAEIHAKVCSQLPEDIRKMIGPNCRK